MVLYDPFLYFKKQEVFSLSVDATVNQILTTVA